MKLITLSEAMNILTKLKLKLGIEVVDLASSLGRVLAEDVISDIDVPPFDKSTRDGYAVKAEDTFTASDFNPVKLKLKGHVKIGEMPSFSLFKNECAYVPTGAPIPQGSDAVIMIEDASQEGDYVRVYKSIAPSRNIIHRGSDIPRGSVLLRRGIMIGVKEISLLAAIGRNRISVFSKPKVAVISTGCELTEVGLPLQAGKIYDVNSHLISSYMKRLSCEAISMGIVADEPERLREVVLQAISISDFVLISGGTSKGEDDILHKTLCDIIKVESGEILFQAWQTNIIGDDTRQANFWLTRKSNFNFHCARSPR